MVKNLPAIAGDAEDAGSIPGLEDPMKWRPRDFSRVSAGDSDILSSCDMNDEHA